MTETACDIASIVILKTHFGAALFHGAQNSIVRRVVYAHFATLRQGIVQGFHEYVHRSTALVYGAGQGIGRHISAYGAYLCRKSSAGNYWYADSWFDFGHSREYDGGVSRCRASRGDCGCGRDPCHVIRDGSPALPPGKGAGRNRTR